MNFNLQHCCGCRFRLLEQPCVSFLLEKKVATGFDAAVAADTGAFGSTVTSYFLCCWWRGLCLYCSCGTGTSGNSLYVSASLEQ
jgi:hypothetical protein